VGGDRGGDLDHLQESERAFLHAGAAGGRRDDQWQAFAGGPLDGERQPLARRAANRPAEEAELARCRRHPVPAQPAFAGDHQLVESGGRPRPRKTGGIGRFGRNVSQFVIPGPERPRVQQRGQQLGGVHRAGPAGRGR
jgi:hypothetical protein